MTPTLSPSAVDDHGVDHELGDAVGERPPVEVFWSCQDGGANPKVDDSVEIADRAGQPE